MKFYSKLTILLKIKIFVCRSRRMAEPLLWSRIFPINTTRICLWRKLIWSLGISMTSFICPLISRYFFLKKNKFEFKKNRTDAMWDMLLSTLSHQISSRSSCWNSMEENGRNSTAKRYFFNFFENIWINFTAKTLKIL